MSPGRATSEQVLTAVQVELALLVKRLIACRNRICRETGSYPDDLGAALRRAGFLLHDILAGKTLHHSLRPTSRRLFGRTGPGFVPLGAQIILTK